MSWLWYCPRVCKMWPLGNWGNVPKISNRVYLNSMVSQTLRRMDDCEESVYSSFLVQKRKKKKKPKRGMSWLR